ncbi:hypothetical protein BGZ60DRAFT_335142, partial [Tricladium varicosporioides]
EDIKVLDWLTPVNYGPQQSDFINRRQPGTGQWLLESEEFQRWLNSDQQTLFCPGIPGAGKTILTSIVVEELTSRFSADPGVGIAYIYCNFQRQDEQKINNLLTSLLKQLAESQSSLPVAVKELYERHKTKQTRPSLEEISRSLQAITTLYCRVFLIVDALDECQVSEGCRKRFILGLSNLQEKYGVNIFATSRPILSIEKEFNRSIVLEIRASKEDVRRYLDGYMFRLPGFVTRSLELQEEIKTTIIKAVDGMFLLAQLYIESLIGKRAPKAVRATLKNLATGDRAYNDAYKSAMERIKGQVNDYKELAIQVLSWITCAKRPLATSELQHALGVEIGESQLDEENIPEIEDIVSACAGLVIVDVESRIIRLVHYTTQEYFERTQRQWFPDAQMNITTTCVTYLSFDTFTSGYCQSGEEFEQRLQLNKLYDYAAHNWGHHAREASTSCQSVIEFLQKQAQVEASSQALLAEKTYSFDTRYSQRFPRDMTGLHLAAYFGFEAIFQPLLATAQFHVDSKDTYGRTPLWYAAANGYEGIVDLLLATEKVDVDLKDIDGRTPLWYATANGHEGIVKLLLATEKVRATEKVDINSKDIYGRTPL